MPRTPVKRETVDPSRRTVVVVPFANISGQPDDDWIGTGIAETVTADLEPFPELSVVAPEALLAVLSRDGRAVPLAHIRAHECSGKDAGNIERIIRRQGLPSGRLPLFNAMSQE